ncbi:hypothetical protein HDU76_012053, partial [Blyttiomyces sp. JEL0837]
MRIKLVDIDTSLDPTDLDLGTTRSGKPIISRTLPSHKKGCKSVRKTPILTTTSSNTNSSTKPTKNNNKNNKKKSTTSKQNKTPKPTNGDDNNSETDPEMETEAERQARVEIHKRADDLIALFKTKYGNVVKSANQNLAAPTSLTSSSREQQVPTTPTSPLEISSKLNKESSIATVTHVPPTLLTMDSVLEYHHVCDSMVMPLTPSASLRSVTPTNDGGGVGVGGEEGVVCRKRGRCDDDDDHEGDGEGDDVGVDGDRNDGERR